MAAAKVVTGITLTLSLEEAEVLCALVGGVGHPARESGPTSHPTFDVTSSVFTSLDELLPDRTRSFYDLFTCDKDAVVRTKD